MQKRRDFIEEGEQAYQEWRDSLWANPEYRATYEEEAAKKELWLQLVEARQNATIYLITVSSIEPEGGRLGFLPYRRTEDDPADCTAFC